MERNIEKPINIGIYKYIFELLKYVKLAYKKRLENIIDYIIGKI